MMKKILLLLIFFIPLYGYSQYLETFNTADRGALTVTPFTTNLTGVDWSVALGTFAGTVSGATHYAKTVSGALEYVNTDKEVCFTTPILDISTPPGARSFSIAFEALQIEFGDFIQVDYQVNSGSWVALGPQFGPGINTVSVLSTTPGNQNYSGNIVASGISGNTLMIRICGNNTSTIEFHRIFSVSVPEAGTVVLPVTWGLVNVVKHDGGNKINWSTHREINNDHFEVERSIGNDGEFEYLASVQGKGNTTSLIEYSYFDNDNIRSTNVYYRIKQVDYDGKYEYSPIVSIKSSNASTDMVMPNPFQNEVTIYAEGLADNNISIVDLQGRLVKNIKTINEDKESLTLDTSDFLPGVYFVKFPSGKVTRMVKM